MAALDLPAGVEITGAIKPGFEKVLTKEAVAFVAELQRKFNARREELLALRVVRQKKLDAGEKPDFLPETKKIRDSDWVVAPLPKDILDRRVELTGPVDRKMIINALNCGANVFMADFEDASTPTWSNMVEGQFNLIDAVRRWSSEQIAAGFNPQVGQSERVSSVTGFVLANPEVTKLWIEDFIAPGNIRDRYPMWNEMVAGVARLFEDQGGEPVDAEVFCTILLTGALIGPRVFRNSVRPDESAEQVVARFTTEQLRLMRAYGLLREWETQAPPTTGP